MSDFSTLDLLIENMDSSLDGPLSSREVECVAKGWRQGEATANAELTRLQAETERLRARVTELEAKAMQVGFDYSQAHILRKQADAAEEAIVFALRTAGNVDPFEVNMRKFANDYAQRLRQQADEAERAGGEHGVCDWCGKPYPNDALQHETAAGDAICDWCAI